MVHGPMQGVRIVSDPPGAQATITPQTSVRGPLFAPKDDVTVRTPATVQLRRDTNYRVEWQKEGYRIAAKTIRSEYDWMWAPLACGACEAVGALPVPDTAERALPVRFLNATFIEYPVGAFRATGQAVRLISPEAILGTSFKLKSEDDGYFDHWFAVSEPTVAISLEPLD
jgi:hypothetical protein